MTGVEAGAVRRFLAQSMTARIATVSPGGRPQIMPLWFVVRGGRVLMSNAVTSPTVRNIKHQPAVQVLFAAEKSPADRRCLRMRGTAEYVTDAALLRSIVLPSFLKYYARPGAVASMWRHRSRWRYVRRYYGERAGGVICVTPVSWQFIEVPEGGSVRPV